MLDKFTDFVRSAKKPNKFRKEKSKNNIFTTKDYIENWIYSNFVGRTKHKEYESSKNPTINVVAIGTEHNRLV